MNASLTRSSQRNRNLQFSYLDLAGSACFLLVCGIGLVLLIKSFRFEVIGSNFWYLMKGLSRTWVLAALTFALALVLAVFLAVGRLSASSFWRRLTGGYIELFRNVPVLMVLFWVYFLLPALLGRSIDALGAAVAGLTVCEAAYLAEVVQAGINSVSHGETEAGLSTGLTYFQTMRWIVLPQALQNMIPSLTNQFVSNFKTTSLVYVIGVIDFFGAATLVNSREFKSMEIFTFVGVVYLANCFAISWIMRRLEKRLVSKRTSAASSRSLVQSPR